jgi:hypothetical protein
MIMALPSQAATAEARAPWVGRIGLAGDWPSSLFLGRGIMLSRHLRIQYICLRLRADGGSVENVRQNPSGVALLKLVE